MNIGHRGLQSRLYKHRALIQLKAMCDEYLCRNDSNPARVAIDVLHFVSQHYVHLVKYKEFMSDERNIFYQIKNRFYYLLKVLRLVRFGAGMVLSDNNDTSTDIIIFSHVNNIENLSLDSDFYFGDLRGHLADNGIKVRYVYLNKTRASNASLSSEFKRRAPEDILLLNRFSLRVLYRAIRSLLKERRRVIREYKLAQMPDRRKFFGKLAGRVLDVQSVRNYAVYLEFERIVQRFKPKTVICTYEGHAFERLMFYAARSVEKSTQCIAYQHTLVYEFQHALGRMIGDNYDPDVILTSGELSRMAIQKALTSKSTVDVKTAGTIRAVVGNKKFRLSENRSACLVAPDGTIDECKLLFGYAITAALLLRNIEFVFRLHPILSHEELKKRDVLPENLPANITLSTATLESDLSRCSWLIYRSSSVAVAGLYRGLRPLYLDDINGLSVDPLFALKKWKKEVQSAAQLIEVTQADASNEMKLLELEWNKTEAFRENYFHRMDYLSFVETIRI